MIMRRLASTMAAHFAEKRCLLFSVLLPISGCVGQDFLRDVPQEKLGEVCKIVDADGVTGGMPFFSVTGKARTVTVIGCKGYDLTLMPSGEIELKTK